MYILVDFWLLVPSQRNENQTVNFAILGDSIALHLIGQFELFFHDGASNL